MDVFVSFAVPAVVGLFIGVLSGMLGIGGGTLLVPIFRLFFGMSPLESVATSLFTIIPTSLTGALSHIRQKTSHIPLGLLLGVSGACTSPLGVWLANVSPSWAVMIAAALVIGYSAYNMFTRALKSDKVAKAPSISEENTTSFVVTEKTEENEIFTRKQWLVAASIGLSAGLISGYVGVGGGFIMVPLMLSFLGLSMKKASGTSLIAVSILLIPGVIEQGFFGNINYIAGIMIAAGSIPGAIIGARLVQIIPERTLRLLFSVLLVVAAILLVLNEFML